MRSLAALTAGVALAVGIVGVSNAEVYKLTEGYPYPASPNATVTASSVTVCSLLCELANGTCDGFLYQPDDTCQLYWMPEEAAYSATAGPDRPAIFLRASLQSQSACPGNATDLCACPADFTRCGGRCRHGSQLKVNYTAAEEICTSLGAILDTPRSEGENQCAAAAARGFNWLGYRGGNTVELLMGADGRGPMNYSNWHPNEPNLSYHDNCICIATWEGLWDDTHCGLATRYPLCQLQNCYRPECP